MARILFVTGKLAEPALRATLAGMTPGFEYDVAVLRITVAALMTTSWIARRLPPVEGFDRIVIPGLCEGDIGAIEERVGVAAAKGPADVRDLPEFFGQAAARAAYGAYDIRIFAEINNVPYLPREEVFRRAEALRAEGADVIDLGCALDRRFDHAAEVIAPLKAAGFTVSIDTFDKAEILAADRAGVDYVLSLHGGNLEVASDLRATPVVIPDPGEGLESLDRSLARLRALRPPQVLHGARAAGPPRRHHRPQLPDLHDARGDLRLQQPPVPPRYGDPAALRPARGRRPGPRLLPRPRADQGQAGAAPREDLRAGAAAPLGLPHAGRRGVAPRAGTARSPRAARGRSSKKLLLLQLDPDKHPSAFDRIVAYDAGVDEVLSYGGVQPADVRPLIHGAVFTRSPNELRHPAVWIGESDVGAGDDL